MALVSSVLAPLTQRPQPCRSSARGVACFAQTRRSLLSSGVALLAATPLSALAEERLVLAANLTKPYRAGERTEYQQLLVKTLKDAPEMDYRKLVKLMFNDAAAGGRNGSVHFRHGRSFLSLCKSAHALAQRGAVSPRERRAG